MVGAGALFLATRPAMAQTPEQFVKQVEAAILAAPVDRVQQDLDGKWRKTRQSIRGLKFDVKKTDSALAPLVGVVQAELFIFSSEAFEDKADAASALPSEDIRKAVWWSLDFVYHPDKRAKRWVFANGSTRLYMGAYGAIGGPVPKTVRDLSEPGATSELAASIGAPQTQRRVAR